MSKIKQADPPPNSPALPAQRRGPRWKAITLALATLGIAGIMALNFLPAASRPGAAMSAKPAHGQALYRQYCVACHGENGVGEFAWQSRSRAAPPLDSSGHAWHHEDDQLVRMILDKPAPDSKMPAWREVLSRDDALDLLAYIKTLWTPYIRDNCQGVRHMGCMRMR